MINYVAIGRRVKKFRNQANITQSVLAEKLGVSISYISQIECGNTEVSLRRLEEIANIINTELQYLVAEPNNNPSLLNLEIERIIKDWTVDQTNTLIKIIEELNDCFYPKKDLTK